MTHFPVFRLFIDYSLAEELSELYSPGWLLFTLIGYKEAAFHPFFSNNIPSLPLSRSHLEAEFIS